MYGCISIRIYGCASACEYLCLFMCICVCMCWCLSRLMRYCSVIWKSDLTDKMKRSFFQAVIVSILLYRCTTWTLTKRMKKKLDGNYTRMLRPILNKSWRQHPTRHQLYGRLPPITKTIKIRRTRHPGNCWWSRDKLISDVLLWTLYMDEQRQDVHLESTNSCSVPIRDVALTIYRKQWTIGRCGERESGISVLIVRQDDDDDDVCIYIFEFLCVHVCIIAFVSIFAWVVWLSICSSAFACMSVNGLRNRSTRVRIPVAL